MMRITRQTAGTQTHSFLKGTENGSVQTHCLKGLFGQITQMTMINADNYKRGINRKERKANAKDTELI